MNRKKTKTLYSLDDLYRFYSNHKNSVKFNAAKSGYNLAVTTKGTFEVLEDKNSEGLLYCKIRAFHDLGNKNKSYISTDVLEENMQSMKDRPIMADIVETDEIDEDGNPVKDFAGHTMLYDEEQEKFIYIEKPVGHFVNPESFSLEYDENYERNFVNANCVIYEEYTDTCDILRRRETVDCSVELIIRDMAFNAKTKELVINDFYVQGCTLLGANVKPGMDGSKVTLKDFAESNNSLFSSIEEDTNTKIVEMLEKLNNTLSNFNIHNEQNSSNNGKEDKSLKFEELLAKYGKTAEDITFDHSNMSDEELESKFAELFDNGDSGDSDNSSDNSGDGSEDSADANTEAEPVANVGEDSTDPESDTDDNDDNEDDDSDSSSDDGSKKKDYVKTYTLSHDDIRSGLYALLEPQEEADNEWYWINEVFDDYFVYSSWSGKIWGQKYTKDDANDTVAFDGNRYELFAEYLTAEEKAELEQMRANYSSIQSELFTYKANELTCQKEAVFTDDAYADYLQTDSFKTLKAEIDKYTVDELKTQCELAYAKEVRKNKIAFSTESQKEKKNPTPDFFSFARVNHESNFLDGLLGKTK